MSAATADRHEGKLVAFLREAADLDDVKARAAAWYEKQLRLLEACHGPAWPENRAWVEGYLKVELREALVQCGWRPKP